LSKILLHTCCAPCTTYVNKWLAENNFEVTGYFYNPNIRPQEEYQKRLLGMEFYAPKVGLKVIYEPFCEVERPAKGCCENCYVVRLKKTAEQAKKLGFDCFTTTLLISPYQRIELIKEVGEKIAAEVGVEFFSQDFRQGFRQSQQMARELKLYRQKYCGCGVEPINKEERVYAQAN